MKKIEEILDEVCWDNCYTNFQGLQDNLRHPTATGHKELFGIIKQVVKEYSKEAEKYYRAPDNAELEDIISLLKYEISEKDEYIKKLEQELSKQTGTII